MSHESIAARLEAWVQEEIGAQERLLRLLEREQESLLGRDSTEVEAAARALEQEIESRLPRERRRDALLTEAASLLGVPREVLTLGSIAERLGPAGERLARMRGDLREAAVAVQSATRRIVTLARYNRSVLRELIGVLVGRDYEVAAESGGCLVDSEA